MYKTSIKRHCNIQLFCQSCKWWFLFIFSSFSSFYSSGPRLFSMIDGFSYTHWKSCYFSPKSLHFLRSFSLGCIPILYHPSVMSFSTFKHFELINASIIQSIYNPKNVNLQHASHNLSFISNFTDWSPFFSSNLSGTPRKIISVTCNCPKWSWAALRVWLIFLFVSFFFFFFPSKRLELLAPFALYNDCQNFWPIPLFLENSLQNGTYIQ